MHLLQICSPGDLSAHAYLGLGNVQRRTHTSGRGMLNGAKTHE